LVTKRKIVEEICRARLLVCVLVELDCTAVAAGEASSGPVVALGIGQVAVIRPILSTSLAVLVLENLAHHGHGSLVDILVPAGNAGEILVVAACSLDVLDILRQRIAACRGAHGLEVRRLRVEVDIHGRNEFDEGFVAIDAGAVGVLAVL